MGHDKKADFYTGKIILKYYREKLEVFTIGRHSVKFKATNLFQVLVFKKQNITVIFVVPPAHNMLSP